MRTRKQAKRVESLKQHVLAPEVERDPSRLTALTAASMAKRDARLARDGEEARCFSLFQERAPFVFTLDFESKSICLYASCSCVRSSCQCSQVSLTCLYARAGRATLQ
jgi:hypothetical protein